MRMPVSLSQIGLYNPQRQSAEITEALFTARRKEFNLLMESLDEEKPDSIPQHHLIIAQRGMGKTTLLKRLEVELHKEQYAKRFIPLLFPEEQYNLRDLAELWLNCLDALADSLESEHYDKTEIDKIENSVRKIRQENGDTSDLSDSLYDYLNSVCLNLKRRPVLLMDNMGLVFNRLDDAEKNSLRACLSEKNSPIIIGAGVSAAGHSDSKEHILDYKAPFYDFFQSHHLKKLSMDEFMELLENLSSVTQTNISITPAEMPRLKSLIQMTGGNPRTSVMLFKLLVKGFSAEIVDDLEALLDEITPLYKARFEELPAQQQIIMDAIAQNWDAISLKEIADETRYANNQLSPQLKRLVDDGWIETTKAYKAKGNAYRISEQFFGIWLLMRRSSRRTRKTIQYFALFLECFYHTIKNQFDKAEELFSTLDPTNIPKDAYCLEQALFALHKRNEGIASGHLVKALAEIQEKLNPKTQGYWEYFAAITVKIGFAQWLLDIFAEKGFDVILSPFFAAIQALHIERQDAKNGKETAEIYLRNLAVEKNEPARIIIDRMKRYF